MKAGTKDIDSKVIFGFIDQVRFGHIFLHNQRPSFGYLTPFVYHRDPGAPGQGRRFDCRENEKKFNLCTK